MVISVIRKMLNRYAKSHPRGMNHSFLIHGPRATSMIMSQINACLIAVQLHTIRIAELDVNASVVSSKRIMVSLKR